MALKESVPMLNKGKMRLIQTYVPRLNCMTITHILGFVVFTSFFRDLFYDRENSGYFVIYSLSHVVLNLKGIIVWAHHDKICIFVFVIGVFKQIMDNISNA